MVAQTRLRASARGNEAMSSKHLTTIMLVVLFIALNLAAIMYHQHTNPLTSVLVSAKSTLVLRFRVVDLRSLSGVQGAKVWVDGNYAGITDTNGFLNVTVTFPATHDYDVKADGYYTNAGSVTISSSNPNVLAVYLRHYHI